MTDTTEQAQPATPGQDQPDPTVAAPPAAPAAPTPVGTGPWANDLATLFPDEAQRSQVDQFLRSKVQPYTTQLEQKASAATDAQKLWDDLSGSPIDTYVAITHEMFGEDAANALLATLQEKLNTDGPQAAPQSSATPDLDPRVASVISYVEQLQTNQYYETELERLTGEHPEVDTDLFHPFVAAAEGDFDEAYKLYTNWLAQYGEKYGSTEEPAAPAAPALGSDTATAPSSATPTEPRKQSLGDAIAEFAHEQFSKPEAPPVGTA